MNHSWSARLFVFAVTLITLLIVHGHAVPG